MPSPGSAVGVKGVVSPATGNYKVTLDGKVVGTYNGTNDVTVHDVVLFFATSLSTNGTHSLIIEAEGGNGEQVTGMVIDKFVVYGIQGSVGFM